MAENSQAEGGFDQGRERLGAVYAKALLGAAEKAGQLDRVLEELDSVVVDIFDKLPQLEATLSSPRVDSEQKLRMLDAAFRGKMSPTLLNFLKVAAQHGRLDCVRAIRHAARKIYNEMRGRVEIWVRTAQPLSNPLRQSITERLKQQLGKDVDLKTQVQPELLGGIVLKIGDTLYDGSLANRLEQTRGAALEATMQSIRRSEDRFATT